MKKCLIIVLLTAVILNLCACDTPEESGNIESSLNIVTTLFPAYDFARQLAGENANVTLLVPPGSEAHSFEPTPQDIVRIENCSLLICNGGESEEWLEVVLEGLNREIPTLAMLDCVEALEEETVEGMQVVGEHDHEHGENDNSVHEHETEYDEHVWTSPVNACKICEAICDELCALDPDNTALYRERCDKYVRELCKLDVEFRSVVVNGKFDTVVFADRFPVRYFVEEYGLKYYAAFPGCADDAEPSARTVAGLIDRVRDKELPAVFYIEFSNEKMADIVCEDTGCRKLLFHSCHNVSADEFEAGVTYLGLMSKNLENLKEALS